MNIDILAYIRYYLSINILNHFVYCRKGSGVMKCSNCGFESGGKFCPKCGAKMPQKDSAIPNVNNAENRGFSNGAYLNAPNPVNNSGQFGFNMNQPQQMPQTPPQPNRPVYRQPVYAQPKKKTKALPIIICSIIGLVIVAGIAVVFISSAFYNQNFLNVMSGSDSSYSEFDNSYDSSADDYKTYGDYGKVHKIDEVYECPVGKVSLTDVKVSNDEMSDEDYCVYAVTFEFENTTGQPLYLDMYSNALDPETFEYCDDVEFLYTDTKPRGDYDGYTVKAGETIKFVEHYKALKDSGRVVFELSLSDIKDYNFDIDIMYEVNLSDYSEQTQETTK